MFIVKLLWSWFTGGGIKALTDIVTRYQDSQIESEKRKYEWAKAQLDALTQVRLASIGFWEQRLLAFLIAFPFVFHLWSVWLDTQFKLNWKIDAFPTPFNEWQGAILLSFFGISVAAIGGVAIAKAFRGGK